VLAVLLLTVAVELLQLKHLQHFRLVLQAQYQCRELVHHHQREEQQQEGEAEPLVPHLMTMMPGQKHRRRKLRYSLHLIHFVHWIPRRQHDPMTLAVVLGKGNTGRQSRGRQVRRRVRALLCCQRFQAVPVVQAVPPPQLLLCRRLCPTGPCRQLTLAVRLDPFLLSFL